MRVYIIQFSRETYVFSLPFPNLSDEEDKEIMLSITNGKQIFKVDVKIESDLSDEENEEIVDMVSQNGGRDLISPIVIPNKSNGNNNGESIRKMIESFKAQNSANIAIKELYMGEVKALGFVITVT